MNTNLIKFLNSSFAVLYSIPISIFLILPIINHFICGIQFKKHVHLYINYFMVLFFELGLSGLLL